MQMVIDIPKGIYEMFLSGDYPKFYACDVADILRKGTPLPEGHGALVDMNKVHIALDEFMYNIDGIHKFLDDEVSTIIEADGGVE